MGSEYQALIIQSKKTRLASTKVSTLIKGITLEILEISLSSFDIHVIKEDTFLEIVLETKVALTRRRETSEDIMLMLQRMMNLPQRELDKTVMILQVMKMMISFLISQKYHTW